MLAVFLPVGESFRRLNQSGQALFMIEQNLKAYIATFQKVYVFTYEREKVKLPKNCYLIAPPFPFHRYLYAFLLPLIHRHTIKQTSLIRCFHLSGTVPALIAKLLYGKKYVFNFGYDYQAFALIEKRYLSYFLFRFLQPLALKFADGIIVKNKTLSVAKSIYIPNGVDVKKFKPSHHPAGHSVLFVGRLEPQKNILTLIETVSTLKQPIKLVIVGDGSLRQAAIDLAKKNHVNLELNRHVEHNQLPRIYCRATVFVLPSIKEGSPKALLEAMSFGLPCILSDIPEHKEIITNRRNGLLVEPTVDSLSKVLKKLLAKESFTKKLGVAARQTIIDRFDQTKLMQQELEYMKSI